MAERRKKKTIVFLHKNFLFDPLSNSLGGAESTLKETSEQLSKNGWNICVIGRFESDISHKGVKYIDFGENINIQEAFNKIEEKKIFACLFTQGYDILNIWKIKNIERRIFYPQDNWIEGHHISPKIMNALADAVILLSASQQKKYVEWGIARQRIRTIPLGVDTNTFANLRQTRENGRIMFAGALVEEKGINELLRAFLILRKINKKASLHIYGSSSLWGRNNDCLEREYSGENGIVFHGEVSKKELAQAYNSAMVCIVPSKLSFNEAFGRSAAEAITCGCPVIGSSSGNIPFIVRDGIFGIIIGKPSEKSLEKAMKRMLEKPQKAKEYAYNLNNYNARGIGDYALELAESLTNIPKNKSKGLILFYTEVPLIPTRTSSCNRNYEIIKILLDKGYTMLYSYGSLPYEYDSKLDELDRKYENFSILFPIYDNTEAFFGADLFWISEVFDAERMHKAITIAKMFRECSTSPVILDTMDFHYKGLVSRAKTGEKMDYKEEKQIKLLESRMYDIADSIITVSNEERIEISAYYDLPSSKISVVSNIHAPNEAYYEDYPKRKDIGFIGYGKSIYNIQALSYFLARIMPIIIERNRNIKLKVIGFKTESLNTKDLVKSKEIADYVRNGVSFAGYSHNIAKDISALRLTIAPMVSGAGIKGKILNSLECKIPVVSTHLGAKGLVRSNSSGVITVDDEHEFADRILELYDDKELNTRMGIEAKEYIKKNYSSKSAERGLDEAIKHAKKSSANKGNEIIFYEPVELMDNYMVYSEKTSLIMPIACALLRKYPGWKSKPKRIVIISPLIDEKLGYNFTSIDNKRKKYDLAEKYSSSKRDRTVIDKVKGKTLIINAPIPLFIRHHYIRSNPESRIKEKLLKQGMRYRSILMKNRYLLRFGKAVYAFIDKF